MVIAGNSCIFFFISFSVATSGDILTIEMGIIIVKLLVRRLIRLIKLRKI